MARKYETWDDLAQECHIRCRWWCALLRPFRTRGVVFTHRYWTERVEVYKCVQGESLAAGIQCKCRRCPASITVGMDFREIKHPHMSWLEYLKQQGFAELETEVSNGK